MAREFERDALSDRVRVRKELLRERLFDRVERGEAAVGEAGADQQDGCDRSTGKGL
jgi:hypothetical protein